jgi:hypothetical protein
MRKEPEHIDEWTPDDIEETRLAVELEMAEGRAVGAYARAIVLTPRERTVIARRAAKARWTGVGRRPRKYTDEQIAAIAEVMGQHGCTRLAAIRILTGYGIEAMREKGIVP